MPDPINGGPNRSIRNIKTAEEEELSMSEKLKELWSKIKTQLKEHGKDYFMGAFILAVIIQILVGIFGIL